MRLVVGLGNPGAEYSNTRHNLGYMVLDKWSTEHQTGFSKSNVYDFAKSKDVIMIKPKTYMNLSGKALKEALEAWKIEEILVIYDDLELNPGVLRIRNGGGDGGHNGLKSISQYYPLNDVKRIRIGIGRSSDKAPRDHVLDSIAVEEKPVYDEAIMLACRLLTTYVKSDYAIMLDEFSKWKKSYSGKNEAGILSPKEEK